MARRPIGAGRGLVLGSRPAPRPQIAPYSQAIVSQGPGQPGVTVQQYAQNQPGAAAPGGPPPDPLFQQQQAQAQFGLGTGEAWDTYRSGQIENDYGLGSDVSNPYSRAKLLEDSYKQQQTGTTNSLASQGQLYSGALQNARDFNAKGYAVNYNQLKRQYQGERDQITKGKLDRYTQYAGTGAGQDLDSVLRSLGLK